MKPEEQGSLRVYRWVLYWCRFQFALSFHDTRTGGAPDAASQKPAERFSPTLLPVEFNRNHVKYQKLLVHNGHG
ncbi:MAG: hypothetical protein ACOX5R_08030 [bacterium]|jgi:hypothetical protein